MNTRIILVITAILLTFNFFPINAQTKDCKINGWVYDSLSSTPVSNVNVIVRGTKFGCTTDTNGYFQFQVKAGKAYNIVFSHLSYNKVVRNLNLNKSRNVEYRIYLVENKIVLPEVTVTGERLYAKIPAYLSLRGDDLERLGQNDLEKALMYYFPRIIYQWQVRETNEEKDFTLYVNGKFKETDYIDKIDPYNVKYIKIWKSNYSNNKIWDNSKIEYTPNELPCRKGNYVVLIVTNDEESAADKERTENSPEDNN